jgi:Kdo2-lipid IVA lauroyltransferase/acyltransferase
VPASNRSTLRNLLETIPAWFLLKLLGLLPRNLAMVVGKMIGGATYYLHSRLRRVGYINLGLALPALSDHERDVIVRQVFTNLGKLLVEFSQFPKITRANISTLVEYDGLENYERAAERGRGVLMLTGHFGAWELCAFAHGAYGHALSFLVRPLDNPILDRMVNEYRELSGNRTINKNRSVKKVFETLKNGEDVGFLIDVNTLSDQGVFCDFFGIPACSTTGLAVFALRTEAPVVPGFLIWDETLKKHRLKFEPEIQLIRTGDFKEEVRLNTARFTKQIEEYARRYPEQWLWVHKRWHTRPDGEPNLYAINKGEEKRGSSVKVEVQV